MIAPQHRLGPWKPGQSGNPQGRPKGSGLTGKLRKPLVTSEAANGANFIVANARTVSRKQPSFVSVIAFDEDMQRALHALGDKDPVALASELAPKAWIDGNGEARPSLSMLADAVLSPYCIQRKRDAATHGARTQGGPEQWLLLTRTVFAFDGTLKPSTEVGCRAQIGCNSAP